MDINKYIEIVYKNNPLWFEEECKKTNNTHRISKIFGLKEYLNGRHKVLGRQDIKYKDKELKVKKLVLQNAKTILNFHSTYLLGKPISLTGSENKVKKFEKVYKESNYSDIDFKLLDKIIKFGDGYEYIYKDGDKLKSKVISNEDAYPVFSDDGEYIAFIEHWTNIDNISYWNVFYEDRVEEWTNEGSVIHKTNKYRNISGLPIHYHGISDEDDRYGEGLLENIIPILDEIEDLLSKMGDSIYTLSLNPLMVMQGQQLEGDMNVDGVGYCINLDNGNDLKYISATMDYNTIKYYLDTLNNELNFTAYMPSIVGGNSNVANVSEVSLKLLYQLADVYAMLSEKVMRTGMKKRFDIFSKLLGGFSDGNYVDVSFNYSRPQNNTELLNNIKAQFDMLAISKRSIIEKSPITTDVDMEVSRLEEEKVDSDLSSQESDREEIGDKMSNSKG